MRGVSCVQVGVAVEAKRGANSGLLSFFKTVGDDACSLAEKKLGAQWGKVLKIVQI